MNSTKIICSIVFALSLLGQITFVCADDLQFGENKYSADDANFSLLPEVSVAENFVRLKNLTTHVFTNTAYSEMLICKKPLKDKPTTLTKTYLENLFKSNGMDEKTLFLMDIPKEIKISFIESAYDLKSKNYTSVTNKNQENVKAEPLTEIDGGEVLLRVSAFIELQLRKYDPQISLYQAGINSNWKVKVSEDYDLKVLPGVMIKANNVSAKVGVYYKNTLIDVKMFNYKADIFIKALVAETNMDKGQLIKKGAFTMQLVPYNVNTLGFIRDEKSLIDFELQKNIKAGEGVDVANIKLPVLINRGSTVNIVIKEEGYSIRATGIAQESGRIGDQIVVAKGLDSKIKCTVTGENTVDIVK